MEILKSENFALLNPKYICAGNIMQVHHAAVF